MQLAKSEVLRISQINSKGAVTAAALTSNRLGYRGGECMSINLTACSGLQLEPKQQEQPEEKKNSGHFQSIAS